MMASASDDSSAQLDNDEMYLELRSRLHAEIAALKETLIEVDKDSSKSVDIINKHTRSVIDVIQTIIDKKLDTGKQLSQFPNPIDDLISVGARIRAEIPLDVIEMMITAGFSVDECDVTKSYSERATCLYLAIEYQQYNVVRLLINHKASCEYFGCADMFDLETVPPNFAIPAIVLLASHPNAPLDLFDLLATPDNLLNALFTALSSRVLPTALHLVKLGAN